MDCITVLVKLTHPGKLFLMRLIKQALNRDYTGAMAIMPNII